MDPEYEKKYHSVERVNWWFRARRQIIAHYLRKFKSGRILDVGCSAGATMSALERKGFSNIYGVDISKKAVEACQKHKLNAFQESADKTSFKENFFDAIIASDILEHTASDSKTLAEWHRILRPGGRILLFVPAFMHLWTAHDDLNYHRKRYTLPELVELGKRHGFVVKKATYWNTGLYLPHFFVTRIKRLFNSRSANPHPTNKAVNFLLASWLSFENALIMHDVKLPFGVSCFVMFEKRTAA